METKTVMMQNKHKQIFIFVTKATENQHDPSNFSDSVTTQNHFIYLHICLTEP